MHTVKLRRLAAAVAVLALIPFGAKAQPIPVDLELVLAVDVSGSVNTTRYNAQKNGYIAAFNNPLVHNAIGGGDIGSIAVQYMEWSGSTQQSVQVDWAQISSATEAEAFADAIAGTSRAFSGLTSISGAIDFSVNEIQENEFDGARQVIDVSGDGTNNSGRSVTAARDDAVAAGMTINGIAIEEVTAINLTEYYENNVIGGEGSFALTATTFEDFEDAILEKLQIEITGDDPVVSVSAPGTLVLMGLGLVGLVGRKRRGLMTTQAR